MDSKHCTGLFVKNYFTESYGNFLYQGCQDHFSLQNIQSEAFSPFFNAESKVFEKRFFWGFKYYFYYFLGECCG